MSKNRATSHTKPTPKPIARPLNKIAQEAKKEARKEVAEMEARAKKTLYLSPAEREALKRADAEEKILAKAREAAKIARDKVKAEKERVRNAKAEAKAAKVAREEQRKAQQAKEKAERAAKKASDAKEAKRAKIKKGVKVTPRRKNGRVHIWTDTFENPLREQERKENEGYVSRLPEGVFETLCKERGLKPKEAKALLLGGSIDIWETALRLADDRGGLVG